MSDSALCATMKALDCRMCMHWIYTDAHQGGGCDNHHVRAIFADSAR